MPLRSTDKGHFSTLHSNLMASQPLYAVPMKILNPSFTLRFYENFEIQAALVPLTTKTGWQSRMMIVFEFFSEGTTIHGITI